MKTWGIVTSAQNGTLRAQTLNDNFNHHVSAWNGALGSENIAVLSLKKDYFALKGGTGASGAVSKWSGTPGTSQTLHYTRRASAIEGGDTVWDPILSIDLHTDYWERGWNELSLFSGFSSWPLEFEAQSGMLVGALTVDWQHGTDMLLVSTEVGDETINFSSPRGADWVSQWGVFVNGVLVGRTGEMPPRRHTTHIPFSIPCNQGPIVINAAFITTISDYLTTGQPHGSEFLIFSATMWVRNIIR